MGSFQIDPHLVICICVFFNAAFSTTTKKKKVWALITFCNLLHVISVLWESDTSGSCFFPEDELSGINTSVINEKREIQNSPRLQNYKIITELRQVQHACLCMY